MPNAAVGVDLIQDGSRVKPAFSLRDIAAAQALRTVCNRILNLLVYSLTQVLAVKRGKGGIRVFGIAGLQFGAFGKEEWDKLFGNILGNNDAFGGITGLSGIAKARIAGIDGCTLQIGIGQDDKRIAAAQFKDGFFQMCACMGGQQAAGMGRTGKCHGIGIFNGFKRVFMV